MTVEQLTNEINMKTHNQWIKCPSVRRENKFFYVTKFNGIKVSVVESNLGPWYFDIDDRAKHGPYDTKIKAMSAAVLHFVD